MKSKKILLFVIALIGTFMINIKGVFALDISVSDVKVNKKGGNISLGDTSFDDKNINSSIEFNELNDYVIYQITLKNNDSEDYTIDSIKDNNTNENISVSYSYDDKKISSKGTQNIYVTLKYNKKLYNKDSISLNDLTFTLNLLDSKGNSKSTIINPITGDSILRYILIFIVSLILIFFGLLLIKRRKSKLFLVFLIALIPSVVFAKKNLSISIRFTNITIKGEMLPYTVSIKDSNGNSTERTVIYGQPVGNLPEVSKVGYTFDKYEDQDGNKITEDTIVKGNLTVTPKFNPITYDITYDYAGGNASNPEHYTIEDDITLSQPTRNGYTFLGWTGTNINTVQNSVRIQNSTGNLNFVAHWSTNQNTPYRVIHKYQKLDGTYEEVVQNLEGPTDEEVTVALLNRDGFTGPQQLTSITIVAVENEEDIPTVTYTYTRNNYSLTLNDDIETTFTKPSYPYGTEITLTAKDKDNYEFIKWSNGETTKTITFSITGNTEIYPIYSRIKYTVTYDPMDGEISPTSQEVNAGESITTLPIPTAPTGKSFDGWYTEETGGSKVNDGYTPTGNITLYARYYTDISGSTITPSSISVKVGETSTIVVNDIEEEYTFESSDTNIAAVNNNGVVTGTGVGTTTITITGTSSGKTKTIDVTVTQSKYTVTYNAGEGTISPTTQEVNVGSSITTLPIPIAPTGKSFDGWYTEETGGNKVNDGYTPTGDITLYARYSVQSYTVSFNTNGGSNVPSQTIEYGGKVTRPTTNPTKTNYIFVNWYTDDSYNTVFDFDNTTITSNTIVYAKFKQDTFPVVFSEPGECTFNGSSGVLTGTNCSYANGTNKYIDTGINLYNTSNHDKDYEIGFTIVSYDYSENVTQATFMNTKLEGNNYPGLVFRKSDKDNTKLDLSSRKTSSSNERKYLDYTEGMTVKLYRIYNEDLDTQEIFYSINDEDKVKINDLSQFNPIFNLSVWFGAAPTNASATSAQRILVGTMKDMYIKLGTYEEDNSEKYIVTFNANGGSVTPTSKRIDIDSPIGTLPTPTAPTGKTFIGWYTELNGGEAVTSSYMPNTNKTIYARYYKDVTGATVSPSSISILNGASETLSISNVEEEYTFSSNNTNIATVDSTGKVTGTGVGTTTITIIGSTSGKTRTVNVTVKLPPYIISFDVGEGISVDNIEVEPGQPVGVLPVPKRNNYSFDGWYEEDSYVNKVTDDTIPTSNSTYYAKWIVPINPVTDCNGNLLSATIPDNLTGLTKIIAEQAYLDNGKSEYVSSCSGIDFTNNSSITNGNGVYEIASTKNDEYPIYYFRGNVTNNNIKFGDFCWKAIRTTETGGVKLIYNGEPDSDGYCSNTNEDSISIGRNVYNPNYISPAYVGYMYGTVYPYSIESSVDNKYYGNSFKYEDGVYKLIDVSDKLDDTHHYSCNSSDINGTCTKVRYYFYARDITYSNPKYYYINLTNGKNVNDALEEMFSNEKDSTVKQVTDRWYKNNLISYTENIEDAIYCNDRSNNFDKYIGNFSNYSGWNPNATIVENGLIFSGYERVETKRIPTLKCENKSDKFTVNSDIGNGSLTYPIGLMSADEVIYSGGISSGRWTYNSFLKSSSFWTSTPEFFYSLAFVFEESGGGNLYDANYVSQFSKPIRPVVSLSPTSVILDGGDGTPENPYVVENINYKIKFNSNGGGIPITSKLVRKGNVIGELPYVLEPENKEFAGWFTSLTDGGLKVTESYIPNGDIEVYAMYYTNVAGAEVNSLDFEMVVGDEKNIIVSKVDESYTFNSNDTSIATVDSNGKVKAIGVGKTTIIIEGLQSGKTKEIEINVKNASYEISFETVGGSAIDNKLVEIGEKVGYLPTSEKTGYSFAGWYEEDSYVNKVTDDTIPTGNSTYYARWEKPINPVTDCSDNNLSVTIPDRLTGLPKLMAENAYLDNGRSQYVDSCSGIDFNKNSSDTNGRGIYEIASTRNDEYPIYYYRGDVTNNNVKFGGFCWKAIRTTETGGVKIIYNGEPDSEGYCSNTTGNSTKIGNSEFNSRYNSLAYAGYMYGDLYEIYYNSKDIQMIFGNSFIYDNGVYKLVDTSNKLDPHHHYSCNSTDEEATCEEIRYYFNHYNESTNYYIKLSNGKDIETALKDMLSNNTNSAAKIKIDNWFSQKLTSYIDDIEDTIYCNDRSIDKSNYDYGMAGFNPNAGEPTKSLYFSGAKRTTNSFKPNLGCVRNQDKFTVSSAIGNGKLKYPVGLITSDEVIYAGTTVNASNNTYYLYTGDSFWTMTPGGLSNSNVIGFSLSNSKILSRTIYCGNCNGAGLRPVISISSTANFEGGDGTPENPYIYR